MKVGVLLLLPGLCLIVFGCSSKDTDTVRFVFAPDAIVRYMHDTGPVSYTHLTLPTILLV